MTGELEKEVTLLIAEDDLGHIRLIEMNLRGAGIKNEIKYFPDGQEAWDFLDSGLEPGRPYVLLLDIKMPRMNGIELLGKIKTDTRLKTMPVIMLTSSDDPKDIKLCHELGCNNYLTKPVAFGDFSDLIRRMGLFVLVIKVDKPAV